MASKERVQRARRARRKSSAEPQVNSQAEPQATSQTDERVKVSAAPDERPAWSRPGWSPGRGDEGMSATEKIDRYHAQRALDEVLSQRRHSNAFGWSIGTLPGFDMFGHKP